MPLARNALLTAAWLALATAAAQAQRVPAAGEMVVEAGVSQSGAFAGLSIAGGPTIRRGHLRTFAIVEAVLLATDSTAQTQQDCEDPVTGEYEWSSTCGPDIRLAGMIEVAAVFSPRFPLTFGAGLRVGFGAGPYFVAGFSGVRPTSTTEWFVRARTGPDFFQVLIGASIELPIVGR
jgi:hypothetical protein